MNLWNRLDQSILMEREKAAYLMIIRVNTATGTDKRLPYRIPYEAHCPTVADIREQRGVQYSRKRIDNRLQID